MKTIEQREFNTVQEGDAYMEVLAGRLIGRGYTGKVLLNIEFLASGRVSFTLLGSKPIEEAHE